MKKKVLTFYHTWKNELKSLHLRRKEETMQVYNKWKEKLLLIGLGAIIYFGSSVIFSYFAGWIIVKNFSFVLSVIIMSIINFFRCRILLQYYDKKKYGFLKIKKWEEKEELIIEQEIEKTHLFSKKHAKKLGKILLYSVLACWDSILFILSIRGEDDTENGVPKKLMWLFILSNVLSSVTLVLALLGVFDLVKILWIALKHVPNLLKKLMFM